MNLKYRRLSGFSLIEIAIVLIILGIILGLTVPLVTASQKISQQKTTLSHQQQITSSLAAYVLTHNKLPSAAALSDGQATPSNQSGVSLGYVPFVTLGLPEAVARDGFGRWFTYVVDGSLTRTDNRMNEDFCGVQRPLIHIKSPQTSQDLAFINGDPVAFVLISHGIEGNGALTDSGTRLAAQGLETINSDSSPDFYDGQVPGLSHKLFWVTRNNFMATYAKSPCSARPQRSGNRL